MRNFTVAILTVLTLFTVSFSQPTWTQSGNIYTLTVGDMVFKVNADYGARITSFTINGTEILYTSGDMSGSTFWPSPQSEWNWPPPEPLDSDAYSATLQLTALQVINSTNLFTVIMMRIQ